ncbi:MAG: exodeoxyribonuclease VII large subunit [Endomicrobiaceae bacterium]|nr:exodeoxyribonuclease VII large subunit [Endomicrobiaceae bacterium]
MNLEDKLVYTVSQINGEIKTILEDSYPAVWITGEISNFKTYSSGHSYFSLKDENSQISAILFAGFNKNLKFIPQDGMQIVVYGKITTYLQKGSYQVQVSFMEETGKGTLQEAFEKLKNKLQTEGLFEIAKKKQIPFFINKIGVVTSKDGAALHDILSVLNRVDSNMEVLIYPVKVQGEQAKFEISQAIHYLNINNKNLDVLLVGRGGGSLEDLWAFNEEIVARAIYNSNIPVISCVGHEVDFTIADFVADLRAPTPSVAAEIVIKNRMDVEDKIKSIMERIQNSVKNTIKLAQEKLNRFKTSRALSKPHLIYEDSIQYVDECGEKIYKNLNELILSKSKKLELNIQKLNLLSPLNLLARGYSVCFNEKGIVKNAKNIKADDKLSIKFSDGQVKAKIIEDIYEKK